MGKLYPTNTLRKPTTIEKQFPEGKAHAVLSYLFYAVFKIRKLLFWQLWKICEKIRKYLKKHIDKYTIIFGRRYASGEWSTNNMRIGGGGWYEKEIPYIISMVFDEQWRDGCSEAS